MRPWVTNEFEHDGLRLSDRVFTHLTDMVRSVGAESTGSPGPGKFAPGHVMAENVAVWTRSGGAG